MDVSSLPFNSHLGLSISQTDGKSAVILQPCAHHLNHLDTVHATVIYGVAEAASGHCLLHRFPELLDSYVAVLRSASVKYHHPASPGDEIGACGTLSEESAVRFYKRLRSRGRAAVDVEVSVTQNDTKVFSGAFKCFVAANGL